MRGLVTGPRHGNSGFSRCKNTRVTDFTRGRTLDYCEIFFVHESGFIRSIGYKGSYRYEPGVDTERRYPHYYNPVRWEGGETEAPREGDLAGGGGDRARRLSAISRFPTS